MIESVNSRYIQHF